MFILSFHVNTDYNSKQKTTKKQKQKKNKKNKRKGVCLDCLVTANCACSKR